jgi:hypothetical protein
MELFCTSAHDSRVYTFLRVVQSGDPIARLSILACCTPDAMPLELLTKLR